MFSSPTSVRVVLVVEFVVILHKRGHAHKEFRHTPTRRGVHLMAHFWINLCLHGPRCGFESQSLGREGQMG